MAGIGFYVDADLVAMGKSLVQARYDTTYPGDPGDPRRGRPPCPITDPSTKDPTWIPLVATQGWVVLSRDRRLLSRPEEVRVIREHGLRVVIIDARRDPTTWGELKIVVAQWDAIERLADVEGPVVRWATKSTFRSIELPVA